MIKRILGCLVVLATFIISCKEDDGRIVNTFSAQVEASNSSIAPLFIPSTSLISEKYKIIMVFSTDNGATYVDYPLLKPGDAYKAKVVYRAADGEVEIGDDACFRFNWAASQPAPSSTNGAIADFTMADDNAISVTVSDYSAYSASSWLGDWVGVEDGACCAGNDPNTLRADPSDPNKIIMDNWWADGVDVYMNFNPSTNVADQTVTIPSQMTSEGGTASGTGTYDQCRGTFVVAAKYTIGGSTYTWTYSFSKDE
ncbi:MAG: hypothetical protein WDO14_08230 [Bacteroidota bacterium]